MVFFNTASSTFLDATRRAIWVTSSAVLLVLLLFTGAPHVFASEVSSDHSAASLGNTPGQIHVVGRLAMSLTPEQERLFEQKTIDLASISRKKDSVIAYSCNRDIEEAGTYVFDEIWPSQMALEDHLKTSHFLTWWDWVQPHLAHDLSVQIAPLDAFHSL